MPNANQQLIHIVGMYKCGTSWLTHVLAAHPQVIAWREFDIIRAVYENRPGPVPSRVLNKLLRILGLPPREAPQQQWALRERDAVMRELFCGRGWIPIMGEDNHSSANTLEFGDTKDLSQVPNYYFEYLQGQCQPGTPMVLKAADQVMCFDQLQACSPHSTKIVIMRDGRDAAISALHYGELMKKWDAPWQPKQMSYHDRLRAWATRASALAHQCAQHDILVLRYEDLQRNFTGTCRALFSRLKISHDDTLIDAIYAQTNFAAVTGGRQPGQAAENVVRKGMTGEWKQALSPSEAQAAWRIAHSELSLFGYTESGEYADSILCKLATVD